jgi:hypothetical protein
MHHHIAGERLTQALKCGPGYETLAAGYEFPFYHTARRRNAGSCLAAHFPLYLRPSQRKDNIMSDEQTTPQADPQPTPEAEPTPRTQEFSVTGEQVLDFVKKALHEGNIRRIVLKDESGKAMLEIPVTIGVVGVILLPVWAAIGAAAALVAKMTIVIEKSDQP